MNSRIAANFGAGLAGGLVGWFLQENLSDYRTPPYMLSASQAQTHTAIIALTVGGLSGGLLGAVDGFLEGNRRRAILGGVTGALFGFLLGAVAMGVANSIFNGIHPGDGMSDGGPVAFLLLVAARTTGWAVFGTGLGIAVAIHTRSRARILHGAVGGGLGGAMGGFLFDQLARQALPLPGDPGAASRLVGFVAITGLGGLFIGLVDEMCKEAWVKVLVGRSEGRTVLLSRAISTIGRSESADIALFQDSSINPVHAEIHVVNGRRVLCNLSQPGLTLHNGQPIAINGEAALRDGDSIQIGSCQLQFFEKGTAAHQASAAYARTPSAPSAPVGVQACPFCGAARDQFGGCQCTVGAATAPGGYSAPPGVMAMGDSAGIYAPAAPVGSAGMMRLTGIGGPAIGRSFSLSGATTSVGRAPGQSIVMDFDATISREHAEIVATQDGCIVIDKHSANGTVVGGVRVAGATPCRRGDVVQFGSSVFRIE